MEEPQQKEQHDVGTDMGKIEGRIRRFVEVDIKGHLKTIRRFGRYPHRNPLLGRQHTAEELEWLAAKKVPFWAKSTDPAAFATPSRKKKDNNNYYNSSNSSSGGNKNNNSDNKKKNNKNNNNHNDDDMNDNNNNNNNNHLGRNR